MKLIGITQRVDNVEKYHETRDALDQRWHKFATQCGFMLITLPNHIEQTTHLLKQIKLSGVILSGGNPTPERDIIENSLINSAYQHQFPLLGICHGMQQIQQHAGISLKKVTGHVALQQLILIHNEMRPVNSYHEYGTTESTSELIVWAKAQDGIIKGIKHATAPIMGIMWHPERNHPFNQLDVELFKQFFNQGEAR